MIPRRLPLVLACAAPIGGASAAPQVLAVQPVQEAAERALPPAPELLAPEDLAARAAALAEGSEVVERLPLYPGLASREGRALLALRLAAPDAPRTRPAILLVAGVDGPAVFTSALALAHCETLARGWAEGDEAARAFLERATLYVVPAVDPDGSAARFASPRRERWATGTDVDTDRDGRAGEDGPADVDGDGLVLRMRVPDPEGTWTADADDERALARAVAAEGQEGRWKLWPEGLDDDGDEQVAEDPDHDARVDRNFAHGFEQHAAAAGRYPMDEPGARALAEFVLLHEDIALVLTYGLLDNLVESPKSVPAKRGERIPPDGVLEGDAPFLAELGRRYRQAVEHEARAWKDEPTAGSFQAWAYHHRGLPSLAVVPWDIPLDASPAAGGEPDAEEATSASGSDPGPAAEATAAGDAAADVDGGAADEAEAGEGEAAPPHGRPGGAGARGAKDRKERSEDARRLAWIDAQGPEEAWRFVPWKPFEHPQLGPVELGGLAPYARLEPPAEVARRVVADQYAFLLSLADALPRARLEQGSARLLGGGLVEVEVDVAGRSLLPVRGEKAIDTRVVRPPRVRLVLPEGATVVAGRALELIDSAQLAGGGREHLRWLVTGLAPGARVGLELSTEHAGGDRVTLEVTR